MLPGEAQATEGEWVAHALDKRTAWRQLQLRAQKAKKLREPPEKVTEYDRAAAMAWERDSELTARLMREERAQQEAAAANAAKAVPAMECPVFAYVHRSPTLSSDLSSSILSSAVPSPSSSSSSSLASVEPAVRRGA